MGQTTYIVYYTLNNRLYQVGLEYNYLSPLVMYILHFRKLCLVVEH